MSNLLEIAWDIFCYASLAYCLYYLANWALAKISPDWKLGRLERWSDRLYLNILGKKERNLKELEDSNPRPNDLKFHFKERCQEKIYDLRNLKYVHDKSREAFKFESVEKRFQIVQDWYDYLLMEKELSESAPPFSDKEWQHQREREHGLHTRKEVIRKRMMDRLGLKDFPTYEENKKELEKSWDKIKKEAKKGTKKGTKDENREYSPKF